MTIAIDDRKLRVWLLSRLNQPGTMARMERFEDMCEQFAARPAEKLTDAELQRIWVDVSNGVSDLPSTSGNLVNANRPVVLRAASQIAQTLSDEPGTRLVKLCQFFKQNGESYNQLAHYIRAAALFDPANAPTVTAYRGLTGKILEALGYTGSLAAWETLIQDGDNSALNSSIRFAFEVIHRALPGADIYAQAIGLELLPGYVKELMQRGD